MVRPARALVRILTLAAVAGYVSAPPPRANAEPVATEYEVKAVYLFNFARFVTWPASAFASPGAPLTICVLGPDPFGPVLDHTLADEAAEGRPLLARRIATPNDAGGCQMLFVGAGHTSARGPGLDALRGRPVLTVGDDEAFAYAGGMVGFRLEKSTVRVTVNQAALRHGGLVMSSQVLRLARLVPGEP